jgi:DNA repair protein SbcC/Rad50
MLITRIELENIKSYSRISIELGRGTTAISGPNGAGKTTLVEAIGFALFDYLPYKHALFIREGEKFGKVVVHILGNDGRPYVVERRIGTNAHWRLNDVEADYRLEQSKDVQDKLHELFGIDQERPLDSLFRDALGVPQGTFTSIFLEAASKRKQTFDALLQIEDYKIAADKLRETQNYYKDQMLEQDKEIQRLAFETRELEQWRADLKDAREEDKRQKDQNAQQGQQLTTYEKRSDILNDQYNQLQDLKRRYESSEAALGYAQKLLGEREQQLQSARTAQQIVTASQEHYQRYEQADAALKQLRRRAQQRDALRTQLAEQQRILGQVEERMKGLQQRLEEVNVARQKVVELAPLVERQIEMERRRDEAMQRVERFKAVHEQGQRLKDQLSKNQRSQEAIQLKIAEIEPLKSLAEQMPERSEALTQLRIRANEQTMKRTQAQELQSRLQAQQAEYEQVTQRLDKLERHVKQIEAHRHEAEEMPALQEKLEKLAARKHHLLGNIEAYRDARAQSAGGQCPFLHETCLNIKQRGIVSLESYFDEQINGEQARLAQVEQLHTKTSERQKQIQKYAEALSKLEQYVEQRDDHAARKARTQQEIERIEQQCSVLEQELQALKSIGQQVKEAEKAFNESKQAEAKVRQLDGFVRQIQQLQEQAQQHEEQLAELRREFDELRGCESELKEVEAALHTLNDPRAQNKTQLSIIAQEGKFSERLHAESQQYQEGQARQDELQTQLADYCTLDDDVARQEQIIQQCQEGHRSYLENQKTAQLLPEREQAYQQQIEAARQAQEQRQEAERAHHAAEAAFDKAEWETVKEEVKRLRSELASLGERMQQHQKYMNGLEQNISRAEAFLVDLEAARKEYQELEDLSHMLESFRRVIKDAAPYILKAMLDEISAESNRIFGEVMGDRSAQLSWQNDYEIILRRMGVNRTFAQLSGGEQMSAALAVRLALLKKLSTLNIAFFDEPTQNMDELRRMNLAEQIRRVRGFDQLVVISHDDTFEQGLDGLVRLQKANGETHLSGDDEMTESYGQDQFIVSASS